MPVDSFARNLAAGAGVASATAIRSLGPATRSHRTNEQAIATRSRIIANSTTAFFSAGGWNYGGPMSRAITTTNPRRPGTSVLRMDSGATALTSNSFRIYCKVPAVAVTDTITVWVYLPELSAGNATVNIYLSSDTPAADPPTARPSNYLKMSTVSGDIVYGCWTPITIHKTGKLYSQAVPNGTSWVTTGTPNASEIEYIEIEYSHDASVISAERYMVLDTVEVNGKAKPLVMLGFDGVPDASAAVDGGAMLGKTRALFEKYGLLGYIANDGNNVASQYAECAPLYAQGWDMISQGMGHRNYQNEPQYLSAEFDQAAAIYQSYGFTRSLDCFAYPFNARSLATDAVLAAKGVKHARAFRRPAMTVSSTGSHPMLAVGSYDAGQKTSAQMIAWLDDAISTGQHMNMYTHIMRSSASTSVETTFSEYATFMAYLADKHYSGACEVVTPSMFVGRVWNDPVLL